MNEYDLNTNMTMTCYRGTVITIKR